MNELLRRMERMFGVPRKDFVESLRKDLLEEYHALTPPLEDFLKTSGSVFPREEFSVRLKQKLIAESSLPLSQSPRERFFPRFSHRGRRVFFRVAQTAVSSVAAFAIIFGVIFVSGLPVSMATTATYLADFSGDVSVYRNGFRESIITPEIPLATGTVITTGDFSSAEIHFFEDSVLRIAANTSVSIDELAPHFSQRDLGFVAVSLKSGRVWMKSFAADEDFSRFTLSLPESRLIINDSGGAIDISASDTALNIDVYDRSAIFSEPEKHTLLVEGKRFFEQYGKSGQLLALSDDETADEWVSLNREKDAEYIAGFVATKTKDDLQKSSSNALGKFLPVGGNKAREAMDDLDQAFVEVLSAESEADRETRFALLNDELWSTHSEFPQETDAFLASAVKTLTPVLPDSGLFSVKKSLEKLSAEFSGATKIVSEEKQRTERLWEARRLAGSGNIRLAETIVRASTEALSEALSSVSPEDAAELLQERQEQLVMLGEMQKEGVPEEAVKEIEEEIVTGSSRILRPGFPVQAPRDLTARANEIVSRVEKYNSDIGQKNTLRHHLDSLDESADNLQLLVKIKKQVPAELEADVGEQIFTILDAERERVRLTKQLPSITPCAQDKCAETPVPAPTSTLMPPPESTPADPATAETPVANDEAALSPLLHSMPLPIPHTQAEAAAVTPVSEFLENIQRFGVEVVSPSLTPHQNIAIPDSLEEGNDETE